jgi:PAS domain S-box-containing protein
MPRLDYATLDALGALVIVLDPGGAIVRWNRACADLTGYSAEEVLHRKLWDVLVEPRDAAALKEALQGAREDRRPRRFVAAARRRAGDRRSIALVASPALEDDLGGDLLRLIGLEAPSGEGGRTATSGRPPGAKSREQASVEEALRMSEERFRVSLESSPVVVFNQDRELRYTWIHNPKDPLAAEQVLGRTDFDLLPAGDAECLARIKRGVIESGEGTRETVRTTLDGAALYYDLTVEPLRDRAGRVVGITCAAWEVSERRRSEREQRFLAEVGEVLMRTGNDEAATLDELARLAVRDLADWFIVDVVEGAEVRRAVLHADPAKSTLAHALATIPLVRERQHLLYEPIRAQRAALVSQVDERYLERVAQGPEHLALMRALELRSFIAVPLLARGRLLGAFGLISSRVDHHYDERDLGLAQQLARVAALAVDNARLYDTAQRAIAARDEILGIVAHDLRSPLHSVSLTSELLARREAGSPDATARAVEAIRRAVRRMDRLIQDMLDVVRMEARPLAIEPAPVDPRDLLEEALGAQTGAASRSLVRIGLEIAGGLPCVHADRGRLLQVFDNLIGNAIKFTPPGGEIVLGAVAAGGEVRFRVADTGVGMSEEQRLHAFDPFWQARKADRRGAGLGLRIVRGIVEAHGGRVWVESEPGRGTALYFTLPRCDEREHDPGEALAGLVEEPDDPGDVTPTMGAPGMSESGDR